MTRTNSGYTTWAVMCLDALERNYREVARRVGPKTRIIASVKADAYGHGAVACAVRLERAGALALSTGDIDEAVAIREAGVAVPIVMFGSYLPDQIGDLLAYDLIPTIYNLEGAEAAARGTRSRALVYVKVDCGLGRLGVAVDEAYAFIRRIAELPKLEVTGVYTHLPFFDVASRSRTMTSLHAFEALVDRLARDGLPIPVTQALASSAVLTGTRDRCNAVCIGHLLYGLSPMAPGEADMSAFEPVFQEIGSRLIHVAHHPAGRDVMIGGHYGISNAMVTGVVPIGMQQGMRAAAAGKTAVMLLRGRRVRVMSVSLEHTTLDLTGVDGPKLGEEVFALGGEGAGRITIEEMARWQGRMPLEAVMTLSRRLPVRHEIPRA